MKSSILSARTLALSALIFLAGVFPSSAREADQKTLLSGVREIGVSGAPGPLCVFGGGAFVVVTGKGAGGVQLPLVAAARYGRGRAAAFGHTGYLSPSTLDEADTGKLMVNLVRWAGGPAAGRGQPINVGVYRIRGLASWLKGKGFQAAGIDLTKLASAHVLILPQTGLSSAEVAAIQRFVSSGGGVIAGGLGWGWKQLNPGKDLATQHPGNQVLAKMGIMFADGMASKTGKAGYLAEGVPTAFAHAGNAFDAAEKQRKGIPTIPRSSVKQVSAVLALAAQTLPPNDRLLLPKLAQTVKVSANQEWPVKQFDILGRLAVSMQARSIDGLNAERTGVHPASAIFPGAVPKDAERVTETVAIDPSIPDWHSTGLYAAPGDTIVVRSPAGLPGKGYRIRIGAHKDRVWHKDSWQRFPEISWSAKIESAEQRFTNPFGGLVYVEVPKGGMGERFEVTISGAVRAPYFVRGKTSVTEWRRSIRNYPGPWAEVASDRVIVTIPSKVVRGLDDPEALMEVWDRILDLDAELAAIPKRRPRPERVVTDQQISAGYMHAGYPIMTWMDQTRNFVDAAHLKAGNWGIFHEFGHNHQERDWTFDGTGEVTCNLFSYYIFEKLCGTPPQKHERGSAEFQAKQFAQYDFLKPDFSIWKKKPFLALMMYAQMQDAFGWQPFIDVFGEYRGLSKAERPRDDAQRRDQWMVRFSRRVNRNLGPFFQTWGIPVSKGALKSIAGLPSWMPVNFPPAK